MNTKLGVAQSRHRFFLHELLSLSQKCRNHTLADSMPELRFAEDTIFGITFAFIVGFVILPTA